MGGVVKGSGRCNAGFLRKHLRGGLTPSVIACGDATFPKGTAFGGSGKVSGRVQRRPLGGAAERSEAEGVLREFTHKKNNGTSADIPLR